MRRFTRLTNAFSKKVENHAAAVALPFMHCNFCPVHQTLRVTPAMEAGISSHVWSIAEIVGLLDASDKSRLAHRRVYHQIVLEIMLLGAYVIAGPIIVAAAAYAFMWTVLYLCRFIPMIGRKHRHSEWDRLNK
jgi:hypothetical protein